MTSGEYLCTRCHRFCDNKGRLSTLCPRCRQNIMSGFWVTIAGMGLFISFYMFSLTPLPSIICGGIAAALFAAGLILRRVRNY